MVLLESLASETGRGFYSVYTLRLSARNLRRSAIPPVLQLVRIVNLLTHHFVKRRLLGTHQWQSALVVELPARNSYS